jgi:hypothetical protein
MVGKPERKRLWRPSHTWQDNNVVDIEVHENQVINSYCTVVLIKNLCVQTEHGQMQIYMQLAHRVSKKSIKPL